MPFRYVDGYPESCVSFSGICENRNGKTYTTVRMVDWIHGNTTSLWPRVALDSELMLSTGCLYEVVSNIPTPRVLVSRTHERLVGSSTTCHNSDHSTDIAGNNLLGAGWELDTSLSLIWVVANNGDIVSGSTSKSTTIANLLLDVGDDGTFWDLTDWEDVSDGEGSVLSGVDELASVHSLVGDESLGVELESIRVAELNLGERSTTSWVVDDVLYDAANVAMSLCVTASLLVFDADFRAKSRQFTQEI
jgi:hypothetical protein